MSDYPEALQQLIDELGRLPGIGERGAERLAIYLLKADREEALGLSDAIRTVKDSLQPCRACFNFSEAALCPVCSDEGRDRTRIMVVESPKDLVAFERTRRYSGLYHVLMGHVSPHEGSALRHLTAERLVERVRAGGVAEVILGTNPDAEGDGTALALARRLEGLGASVTRLARGLPSGFSIEFAGTEVLADALEGRRSAPQEES